MTSRAPLKIQMTNKEQMLFYKAMEYLSKYQANIHLVFTPKECLIEEMCNGGVTGTLYRMNCRWFNFYDMRKDETYICFPVKQFMEKMKAVMQKEAAMTLELSKDECTLQLETVVKLGKKINMSATLPLFDTSSRPETSLLQILESELTPEKYDGYVEMNGGMMDMICTFIKPMAKQDKNAACIEIVIDPEGNFLFKSEDHNDSNALKISAKDDDDTKSNSSSSSSSPPPLEQHGKDADSTMLAGTDSSTTERKRKADQMDGKEHASEPAPKKQKTSEKTAPYAKLIMYKNQKRTKPIRLCCLFKFFDTFNEMKLIEDDTVIKMHVSELDSNPIVFQVMISSGFELFHIIGRKVNDV